MKRSFFVMISMLLVCTLCVACAPQNSQAPAPSKAPGNSEEQMPENPLSVPTATPNPNITRPEGQVMGGENPFIAGKITALTDDAVTILAEGVSYELQLGKKGKSDLRFFNKDKNKPKIMLGTYIVAYYHNRDEVKTVESLEILEAN